ncbi:hypothetical protein ABZW96_08400 [Nocardia sp. NPDC004168]|uniref:hypothetical protein n=1 Tax=Nocardia sp. NPDC004168 TaxID=3154452 RepID=UPI0033B0A963
MQKRVMLTSGSVTVLDEGRYWAFNGVEREAEDYDQPNAHIADLRDVPAVDIQSAMRRYAAVYEFDTPTLHVIVEGKPDRDIEHLPYSEVSFTLHQKKLIMELNVYGDDFPENEEVGLPVADRVLPLLARKKMELIQERQDLDSGGNYWHVNLKLGISLRGRSLQALANDGLEVVALLKAVAGGLTRSNVLDLLRGGFAGALIGQHENDWLEVKREHYSLREDGGQLKLARSVAQFANSPDGGLVLIGFATKKDGGKDMINSLSPTPHDPNLRRRYMQNIQHRVYPQPDGLRVEVIAGAKGDFTIIDVPRQPEELKPFLVYGAVVDGRINNTFVSIIERRGDEGLPSAVPSIHAMLVAGRALLRRGRLPGEGE